MALTEITSEEKIKTSELLIKSSPPSVSFVYLRTNLSFTIPETPVNEYGFCLKSCITPKTLSSK